MLIETIGFIAGVLTTAAFLPQVIKVIVTKHAKDLSYGLLSLQSSGNFLWIFYAVNIHAWPLAIANAITFLLVFVLLILKFFLNKK